MEMDKQNCFGKALAIAGSLGIGGCMDVAVEKDTLVLIARCRHNAVSKENPDRYNGSGCLYVMDITNRENPRIRGRLTGLGNVRQVELVNGIAYVVSREDGMFIVDIKKPEAPRLLAHYDTIEFATGLSVSDGVAFVGNRYHGVELIDISNSEKPTHIGILRSEDDQFVWEAQSVFFHNGYLYASNWGGNELVICDVRNVDEPRVIARVPVDGRSDGVFVEGEYCYVVTGHHGRNIVDLEDKNDPAYGMGNGLEIFNVSSPEKPKFVSRIKLNRFYKLGNDMWSVTVQNGLAYIAHTFNGVFIVDIAVPEKPVIIAHATLPYIDAINDHSPVGGLALAGDYIYAAGIYSGLHIIKAAGMVSNTVHSNHASSENAAERAIRVYQPGGQVYSAAIGDEITLIAAGTAGIHAVRVGRKIENCGIYPTEGFAMDIKTDGRIVYVAEGYGGMSIWKIKGDYTLEQIGRYRPDEQYTVKQVVVPSGGKYALLQTGSNLLHIVDVSDPANPRLALEDSHLGLLYYTQIGDGLLEKRYACCFWHVAGIYWYDLGADKPVCDGCYGYRLDFANGIAFLDEAHILLTHKDGYVILDRHEQRHPDTLTHYGIGMNLKGKPNITGNILTVSNRYRGTVTITDISDISAPRLIDRISTAGNPGAAVIHKGSVMIPAGYRGLMIYDVFQQPSTDWRAVNDAEKSL